MNSRIIKEFTQDILSKFFLPIITIYENPKDHPGKFVARVWDLTSPTEFIIIEDSYKEMLKHKPQNMVIMLRDLKDDPIIRESWI
jgi:hypothetical protein